MYQEMYKGIIELLRVGNAEDLQDVQPIKYPTVAQALNLIYNIDIEYIHRINKIDIGIEPIYLVLADPMNGKENASQLFGYIMIEGRPSWVVLFNHNMLIRSDQEIQMAGLVEGIKSLCRIPMMPNTNKSYANTLNTIQYYACLFVAVKLLHRYYPSAETKDLTKACKHMYMGSSETCNITDATIIQTINLLTEFDLYELLDNSYFLGTYGNSMYSSIWFADQDSDEMDDTDADIEQFSAEDDESNDIINFEWITARVNGMDVLFTENRVMVDDEELEEGQYLYELRSDSLGGEPKTIEKKVAINFAGTILTDKEIPLNEGPESDPYATVTEFEILPQKED